MQGPFVLDANFFIAGWKGSPREFELFHKAATELQFQLVIPSKIVAEIRWYLRRRILRAVKVARISTRQLESLQGQLSADYDLPQLNDLSLIAVAQKGGGTIVSSDLKLLRLAEQLGIKCYMGSAFALYLIEQSKTKKGDTEFLQRLYDRVYADEVGYSLESKDLFDPIARIRKIQDQALGIVRDFAKGPEIQETAALTELKPCEQALSELLVEIQLELPNLQRDLVGGDYVTLVHAIREMLEGIAERSLRIQLELKQTSPDVLYYAAKNRAYLLFLIVAAETALLDLDAAAQHMSSLIWIAVTEPHAVADIEINMHFLRLILALLRKDFDQLQVFYSPEFMSMIALQGREDLSELIKGAIIVFSVLMTGSAQVGASFDSDEPIDLLLQLGENYTRLGHLKEALLVLTQAVYSTIASDEDLRFIVSAMDAICGLHFMLPGGCKEHLLDLYEEALQYNRHLGEVYDPEKRLKLGVDVERLLTKTGVDLSELESDLQNWMQYLVTSQPLSEFFGQRLIVARSWSSGFNVGLIDQHGGLNFSLKPGQEFKLFEGGYKVVVPTPNTKEMHNVDVLVLMSDPKSRLLLRNERGFSLSSMDWQM